MHDRLQLLVAILAQWGHPAASIKAPNLLHWAMSMYCTGALPQPSKWPAKLSHFFHCCFLCCCLGGRWGNTKQVIAQWWCPVASEVALDMPHQAMLSVLLRRTAVAIKMANSGGASVHHCCLFCMIIRSYKTMLWPIKTNAKLQY
jgi:hypothetical protein